MGLMGKRETFTLRSDFPVEDCLRRLSEGSDVGQRTIFSLSSYKGSKRVLSKFEGNGFRLWKRRTYRNDFAPIFFGAASSERQGTRIEGRFDVDPLVKIFMGIWLGFVIVIGTGLFISALLGKIQGDARVGLIIPPAMVGFGLLMPQFGRFIGRGEEKSLREFLQTTLAATQEDSSFVISQRTIENKPL